MFLYVFVFFVLSWISLPTSLLYCLIMSYPHFAGSLSSWPAGFFLPDRSRASVGAGEREVTSDANSPVKTWLCFLAGRSRASVGAGERQVTSDANSPLEAWFGFTDVDGFHLK